MNKKYIQVMTLVVVLLVFSFSVEMMTRYRLDELSVPVLNAVHQQRETILEGSISHVKMSRKHVLDDMVLKKEDLIDHVLSMNHTIYKGQPILKASIENPDLVQDAPLLLLKESQAVFPIKSDLMMSSGKSVLKGHFVDVNLLFAGFDGHQSELLLSRVRVIGVRDRKGIEIDEVEGEVPAVILLAVNKDLVSLMMKASALGDFHLSLNDFKLEGEECILNEGVVSLLEF